MAERELTFDEKLHHYMGIEMNGQTWALLEKKDRTAEEANRMVFFAHASLYHWKKSPASEPVNSQRGEWLIARVWAVLEKGDNALAHARNCMQLTEENKLEGFDRAYAHEAMARAYAALKDQGNARHEYDLAREAGEAIPGEEDRKMFLDDLQAEPWFGMVRP